MAIFVDQELSEVPLDAIPEDATFVGHQELVNKRSIITIYINLNQKQDFSFMSHESTFVGTLPKAFSLTETDEISGVFH